MGDREILTYTDTSVSRRQTLTLYDDRVQLDGRLFLEADYSASFDLRLLSPDYHAVTGRDRFFWGSLSPV